MWDDKRTSVVGRHQHFNPSPLETKMSQRRQGCCLGMCCAVMKPPKRNNTWNMILFSINQPINPVFCLMGQIWSKFRLFFTYCIISHDASDLPIVVPNLKWHQFHPWRVVGGTMGKDIQSGSQLNASDIVDWWQLQFSTSWGWELFLPVSWFRVLDKDFG